MKSSFPLLVEKTRTFHSCSFLHTYAGKRSKAQVQESTSVLETGQAHLPVGSEARLERVVPKRYEVLNPIN